MKRALSFFILCALLSLPFQALAALDGQELLQKCGPIEKLYSDPEALNSKEASGVVYCLGYVDSFIDTFSFQVQAKIVPAVPYCLPEENLPKKELAKVVVEYLKNHSEELDSPAGLHIFMALREAYPCNREENEKVTENKISGGQ